MIQSFLDTMDLKFKNVRDSLEQVCPFAPGICVECASAILMPPSRMHIPRSEAIGVDRVIEAEVPPDTTDMTARPIGAWMQDLLRTHAENGKPALVIQQSDLPAKIHIDVNAAFEGAFGVSNADANNLFDWSGIGFLPWGGDVLGKIIVSESDLLSYLQVMCIKFQTPGVQDHSRAYIREVPSTHSFGFWLKGQDGMWEQKQCIMQVLHRVLQTTAHLAVHAVMCFDVIGSSYRVDPSQVAPVVSRLAGVGQVSAEPQLLPGWRNESAACCSAVQGTPASSSTASAMTSLPETVGNRSVTATRATPSSVGSTSQPSGSIQLAATQLRGSASSPGGGALIEGQPRVAVSPPSGPLGKANSLTIDTIPDDLLGFFSSWDQVESTDLATPASASDHLQTMSELVAAAPPSNPSKPFSSFEADAGSSEAGIGTVDASLQAASGSNSETHSGHDAALDSTFFERSLGGDEFNGQVPSERSQELVPDDSAWLEDLLRWQEGDLVHATDADDARTHYGSSEC
mmetsp:Transcript_18739/g.59810  ORF Transcript_18739/g.59810 Transcript_18739/m.59810 type:complete len:515 (-) Transcript_18739:295-1839(-)